MPVMPNLVNYALKVSAAPGRITIRSPPRKILKNLLITKSKAQDYLSQPRISVEPFMGQSEQADYRIGMAGAFP